MRHVETFESYTKKYSNYQRVNEEFVGSIIRSIGNLFISEKEKSKIKKVLSDFKKFLNNPDVQKELKRKLRGKLNPTDLKKFASQSNIEQIVDKVEEIVPANEALVPDERSFFGGPRRTSRELEPYETSPPKSPSKEINGSNIWNKIIKMVGKPLIVAAGIALTMHVKGWHHQWGGGGGIPLIDTEGNPIMKGGTDVAEMVGGIEFWEYTLNQLGIATRNDQGNWNDGVVYVMIIGIIWITVSSFWNMWHDDGFRK